MSAAATDATAPIAHTTSGSVRGVRKDGVDVFLGVPYAASPVGARRFAPPQPPEPWSGVRDATVPGATAPQFIREFPQLEVTPLIGEGWRRGDDYLVLNVWAPADDRPGKPVMCFVHGGAFVLGNKDAPVNDGTAFARDGIVCIAINYRMGIEGFLPIDGAPTNLGLRDQLAALRWVQQNAARFGGDPANVTVFGESAGAMSIACLVASPLAHGLFRRAIIQSGHGSMVRPIDVAQRLTRRIAKFLRVAPDVAGFGSRSAEQCVAAMERVQRPTTRIDLRDDQGREPAFGLSRFLPVVGDDVLPAHPLTMLAQGGGSAVELLIGTNREEMNLYFVPTGVRHKLPRLLAWYLLRKVEPDASRVLKSYGLGTPGVRAGDAFTEALHDLVFRSPARKYADAHRGRRHFYEFDWRSPACGGQLGACHGLELPFVFDTLQTVTGPRGLAGSEPPQALADRVHRLWVQFASNGDLPWPAYDTSTRQVYHLAAGEVRPDPAMPAARVGV
jgi:para-nitrobenzyl esterase